MSLVILAGNDQLVALYYDTPCVSSVLSAGQSNLPAYRVSYELVIPRSGMVN